MKKNKTVKQLNQEHEKVDPASFSVSLSPSGGFVRKPRPEPTPLGSICDDPDDLTNFLFTVAFVTIFVLVIALLILAIITMGELLDVVKMIKLEGGL